jgi:ABC-type sulfate transport system substrate-binding protein
VSRSDLTTLARAVQDLTRQRLGGKDKEKGSASLSSLFPSLFSVFVVANHRATEKGRDKDGGDVLLSWDDFATLMSMPIEEEDIKTVWKILDSEKKGTHAAVVIQTI